MSSMFPSFGGAARQCVRCGASLASNESQCSRCGAFNQLPQQEQQFGSFQQGSGSPWRSQVVQTPQFPQAGNGSWASTAGSANGRNSTGQTENSWLNDRFSGQNQQSSPSQQLQQSLFSPPFDTTSQSGFNNSSQSALNNSFGSFQQNPNQSAPNNSLFGSFQQNPNQSALNNSFGSFQQNPNQSAPNNSLFDSFQQNPNQSALNSFFNATQQNGTLGSGALNGSDQSNWQARRPYQQQKDDNNSSQKRPNALALAVIIVVVLALIGGAGYYGFVHFTHGNNTTGNAAASPVPIVTPSGPPLFKDTFQNDNNGWDMTQPAGASIKISGGKMLLESDNNKLLQENLPGGKTFSDLRVDINANLISGDQANGYGIYIRSSLAADGTLGTYYRFEAYGDGTFAIYKGVQNADGSTASNALKSKTASNALFFGGGTNPLNHLTVIAKGTQMSFQINGTAVYTFSDNSYKSGSVALFVSNVQGVKAGAQATFTNLAIFPPA